MQAGSEQQNEMTRIMIIGSSTHETREYIKTGEYDEPYMLEVIDLQQAERMLFEFNPDVIILDRAMTPRFKPFMRELRINEKYQGIITIVLTIDNYAENASIGYSIGVDSVLLKSEAARLLPLKLKHLLSVKSEKDKLDQKNLELQQQKQALERDKATLGKYFSADLIEAILRKDVSTEAGGGSLLPATILFFDLRNSTGIAERLEPEVFSELLSLLFTDIMDIIFGNMGSVNKILGDGILATFGCPTPTENDMLNAIKAACSIRKYLQTFNAIRPEYLEEDLAAGIGVATGRVFAGNIGSVNRMEYTVLGDPVNVAARLQSLTKKAGVDILIDEETRMGVGEALKTKQLSKKEIRGRDQQMNIYYPVELLADDE